MKPGAQSQQRLTQALELIVCPVCHAALTLDPAQSSAVECSGCSRRYPVEDGIPVLLEARAALPA